ncbi:MAG: hypothetical protein ABFD08_20630 [Syntrophomonas sp.]
MEQSLSIWSKVIVAELNSPQKIKQQSVFALDPLFQSLEDIKVKLKNCKWSRQGQTVETLIKLDVLLLLEDSRGNMQLLKREENLRDRVPFRDFSRSIEDLDNEKKVDFSGDIQNIAWQGDLMGNELHLTCIVEYVLMATREQVVKLPEAEAELLPNGRLNEQEKFEKLLSRMEDENVELRRKIYVYERDISSLKRGIEKVEKRNALLSNESRHFHELTEKLQEAMREKEARLNRNKNSYYQRPLPDSPFSEKEASEPGLNLGSRVKRMFLNSI